MSIASVISSATCNYHLLTPSASVMVKMKGRGRRFQLLKGQNTSLLRVWKLERCCCGRDRSGIGKLRTRDAKGGVICSASNGFEEEEVGSIGDRLRWIQSREVPLARKFEGINPPKYPKLAENMSQEASRRDGLLNEAERLSHRRIDEEDLYIDPRSIGNGSKTRVEGDFSAEDPWLIKERNGSSSIQTNQAMYVAKAMPTTLNAERKPFDPVQFNAKEPQGSVNTQKSPNQPFSYLDDSTSNGQQAGRRIDTGYENYRAVRTIEDSYATDNSVGDDDSDELGEDQGTVARESDAARGTSGLGRWDKSRTGSEDLSIDYSKRFLLFKRSNLIAKQVVSVSNATILGFVSQLWVDLQTLNVEALEIKPSLLSWQTDEIFLNNLSKIGDVILAKNDNVLDGDLTVPNCEALVGSDVLTENNVYLGKVRDYHFNFYNGAIVAFEMDPLGVPFIPAKMISTYLVMVDEIIDIARDCLLLRKGAESRIQRLRKGFFQSSIIDIEMMQAEKFEDTRSREPQKERKKTGSAKGKSRVPLSGSRMKWTYSSNGAVPSAEPTADRSFIQNSTTADLYAEETEIFLLRNSRESSLPSLEQKKQSFPLVDSAYDYRTSQSSGPRSVLAQTADQPESLKQVSSTEAESKISKKLTSLPGENEDMQKFRPGYGKDRWAPIDYKPKKRNQT